jgi:hypothetical protein
MTTFQTAIKIPQAAFHPILGWRGLVVDFARDSTGFLTKLHNDHGRIVRIGEGKCLPHSRFIPITRARY